MNTRKAFAPLWIVLLLAAFAAPVLAQGDDSVARPAGWDAYSHGNDSTPDYAVVFPQDAVNTITITISPENWQAMLDDMTDLYGEFGTGRDSGGMRRPDAGEPPQGQEGVPPFEMRELPQGQERALPPEMDQLPQGQEGVPTFEMGELPQWPQGAQPHGMGMGPMLGSSENPIWVEAEIAFEGQVWTHVGIRFKGNSSLMSSWSSGIFKLPFKLDFDEFEDAHSEIDNQRFYGFKQLSFSSGFSDPSLLREKITADIFWEAGVPAAQTAFYAVYIDYGEGPLYFGLYTAVELVDDTVIETQFADDSGNVYKPEGTGATFAEGSFAEASFDKETNADEADYSDILDLFEALHAETRTTDPAAWRSGLEAIFDVDGFLRWLAVNTVVQNWDTYGQMAHNYYLYHDPTTGLITWIPWDNNMALSAGMGAPGGPGGHGGSRDGLALDLESIDANWPLIRYLMDDRVYHERYVTFVEETINGAFEPEKMTATYQALHNLVAPYVIGETGEQLGYTYLESAAEFETALDDLIAHVNQRCLAAQEYLASQTATG